MRGGGQNFTILSQEVAVSQKQCEIGPRLLLITNRKSYTGFRLPPRAMTLDDLERQNRGLYGFFGDFGLRHNSIVFARCCHATNLLCNADGDIDICILT